MVDDNSPVHSVSLTIAAISIDSCNHEGFLLGSEKIICFGREVNDDEPRDTADDDRYCAFNDEDP